MKNMFENIPSDLSNEQFLDLLNTPNVRIERIVSRGHTSPETGWYDQDQDEWVMVLEGSGTLTFEDGRIVTLNEGDFIHISAHDRHKVSHTRPDDVTVWLAVFFRSPAHMGS
ncbi:cupin 2 domain-containing protein [Oceanisphaera litoralis]|uniref:cupin domain-containing protein n=1 Tax=Oceanisphaera litoralis TaxID=225144 RepID=UPI001958F1C7|nr:cupin domain-containing protein [Oceanisphaera litoralis]MBM7457112.1 cupin 2 domain-containing protein [Oceanisphaera litoralis]